MVKYKGFGEICQDGKCNKAAGITLLALARALGCRVEDLPEYDNSEIEEGMD